jgi:hypothetical protein
MCVSGGAIGHRECGRRIIENCVLLCAAHHRHVHYTGWEIHIHHGHVEFIPPAIIDPTRTPLHDLLVANIDCPTARRLVAAGNGSC